MGRLWYAMVCYVYGTIWYGMICVWYVYVYGIVCVWYGTVRYGMICVQYGMVSYMYGMVWYGMVRYGVASQVTVQYEFGIQLYCTDSTVGVYTPKTMESNAP